MSQIPFPFVSSQDKARCWIKFTWWWLSYKFSPTTRPSFLTSSTLRSTTRIWPITFRIYIMLPLAPIVFHLFSQVKFIVMLLMMISFYSVQFFVSRLLFWYTINNHNHLVHLCSWWWRQQLLWLNIICPSESFFILFWFKSCLVCWINFT